MMLESYKLPNRCSNAEFWSYLGPNRFHRHFRRRRDLLAGPIRKFLGFSFRLCDSDPGFARSLGRLIQVRPIVPLVKLGNLVKIQIHLRWRPSREDRRWFGRLTYMQEYFLYHRRFHDERDQPHGLAALCTSQRQALINGIATRSRLRR